MKPAREWLEELQQSGSAAIKHAENTETLIRAIQADAQGSLHAAELRNIFARIIEAGEDQAKITFGDSHRAHNLEWVKAAKAGLRLLQIETTAKKNNH